MHARKGLLIGSDYQDWVLKQAGIEAPAKDVETVSCVRVTLISNEPLSPDVSQQIATFVYPPGTFKDEESGTVNTHPIRVFQLDNTIVAAPYGMYLIMAIMQLDHSVDSFVAKKPFLKFIE